MVEVGDKIFVAPVGGQKDNIAVITGPAGAGAVLNEGDYNTWTLEWCKVAYDPILSTDMPGGVYTGYRFDFMIDDKNDTIHLIWETMSRNERYGIFSCADFTNLFLTPGTDGEYDPWCYNFADYRYGFVLGSGAACQGFSRSIQSYVLYVTYGIHDWVDTLDVVRNASRVWHRSVWDDLPAPQNTAAQINSMAISTTGKYILCISEAYTGGNSYDNLLLYKGSYVE